MFSARLPERLDPNPLSRAVARARAAGIDLLDLTESNPTRVGLTYPPDLLAPLAGAAGLVYEPVPFGLLDARRAVAALFAEGGRGIDPAQIALVASTSEAYSLLFKLLCNPGDVVLVPQPSYPLCDHLARLEGVAVQPFRLEYDGRWRLDLAGLARDLPPRARTIIVVNPNNPTGSFLTWEELAELAAFCRARDLTLVGDEVFADYLLPFPEAGPGAELRGASAAAAPGAEKRRDAPPAPPGQAGEQPEGACPTAREFSSSRRPPSVLDQREALTFALGGLSKAVGLPQLKLAWIVVHGPDELVDAALARLEYVCDAYLSVATPVQHALAQILREGRAVRAQIARRIETNYRTLHALAAAYPACRVLHAEGGWYGVVQVPATRTEEALVVDLVERDHVVVHPGFLFDFPREAFLVVSLLPEPTRFAEGLERVFRRATVSG